MTEIVGTPVETLSCVQLHRASYFPESDAVYYRAEKSLKTALRDVTKRRRGSDEVIIVEVSSSDE